MSHFHVAAVDKLSSLKKKRLNLLKVKTTAASKYLSTKHWRVQEGVAPRTIVFQFHGVLQNIWRNTGLAPLVVGNPFRKFWIHLC